MNKSKTLKSKSRHTKAAAIQLVLIMLSFMPVLCLNWVNNTEDNSDEAVITTYEFGEAKQVGIRP